MKLAMAPDPEQIQELMRGPADTPVVMVNLLRFRERASADPSVSGASEYQRYGARMREIVERAGGRFLWSGRVDSQLIGSSDVDFHVIALVEYPSRRAFLEIIQSPEVQKIGVHRAAGLEGQWLIATTAAGFDRG